jgi:FAD/FMN-containing dehydrogenase
MGLERALRDRVDGEVRFDAGSRGAYSTDASNFRQVPIGVVVPRTPEAAAEAVGVCREHGVPVLSRGGGTSLAGQCTNTAVVLDWSKYCHRVLAVDPHQRTCTVEPGIVLDQLNASLVEHGLRFGPEPATHMNCTLGGMIGNNSCGATAQRTGKVVDNIAALEVVLYDGTRFWCGPTSDEEYAQIERRGDRRAEIYRRLRRLRDGYAGQIRERYPDIPRRVSGYNLDSLLPERGFDIAGLLVGSESTLVTVLRAKLKLIPVLSERSLVVLGYPSVASAADAVPAILPHQPIALEGLDHRLIHDEQAKHLNQQALADLPQGSAFLMVQFGADSQDEVDTAAQRMLDALHDSEHDPAVEFLDDPARENELWQVREAGLGATAHVPHQRDTWEGWEDSAVAPDRLGDYLRDLDKLYGEFGYRDEAMPALYGHFGQGCVHTRIPFDLYTSEGVATYRAFMERAADLVVSYGGSLSGEHGDGQSRGELLERMFGPDLVGAFGELKDIFDPADKMNPGKVVRPARLDQHLRLGGGWAPASPQDLFFRYPHDGGSFTQAASRCVGVGKCAKRMLRRTVAQLAGHVRAGGYVVGLEPSCTAVFRSDAPELFPDDQDVLRLRDHTLTLAELLTAHTPGWQPPRLAGREVLAQVHCHQHAVLGFDAETQLLDSAGAQAEALASGCCGLAGNFGFQPGHAQLSQALAGQALLPRLRDADPATVILADGFSCRTQIHELNSGGREAMHLAELLDAAQRGDLPASLPEEHAAPRPVPPSQATRLAATAGVLAGTAATVAVAITATRCR